MIESVHIGPYGRSAMSALGQMIRAAQQHDPLAPVTVVVATNLAGLSARRTLGSGAADLAGGSGLANVSFVTPFRLAELVAADLPLDTAPLTNPVLGAAVRRVLADKPGMYWRSAAHESTEAALSSLFAELSNVDEAGIESMLDGGGESAAATIDFFRRIGEQLDGFHTEHDLATMAAGRFDLSSRLVGFGHVIWFLPAPLSPALTTFMATVLSEAVGSSVVVGLTGVDDADRSVCRVCAAVGVAVDADGAIDEPVGDLIVSVTDAPEEVREVCERVVALAEDGVALHRIGVFYPWRDPYVRIIEQQFATAGIPANGPDARRLADSVAGRTLLGVLELPDHRWRRHRVMGVVSAAPLRFDGGRVRPTVWDALSREAGVVAGLGDWRQKLATDARRTQEALDAEDGSSPRRTRALQDRLHDGAHLLAFVERLAASVATIQQAAGWPDKCAATADLLRDLLGSDATRAWWPEHEIDAFTRVEDALVRLAALDHIEPTPSHAVFQRALRNELDVARGRSGRFGHGVLYGPLSSAAGHDLDAVFVVGCTEGLMPMPRRDDAVLPDRVRMLSLDQLELKSARLEHQHRAFLCALAAAPVGRRVLTFPRGDIRSNRRALPSRWLLRTATALAKRPIFATDFEALRAPVVAHVDSAGAAVRDLEHAASVHDRDLAALTAHVVAGGDVVDHPAAALTGRGIEMQLARASADFTEFDGNLASASESEAGALRTSSDGALSPSRLETWASCGFRYFLTYVLGVRDRDDPDRIDELGALDRGSLIHRILERFIDEAIISGPPTPDTAWSAEQRRHLHEIADEEARRYRETGRTGRDINWQVQLADLHDVLDLFVDADDRFRATADATPRHVELDLGVRTDDHVTIHLPNGSDVRLRGFVDRVDTSGDGSVLISDYKSGRSDRFKHLDDDPFLGGTTLQLGMYAEGALQVTGAESASAHYWLVEQGDVRAGYRWDEGKRQRFHEVLTAITEGIGGGVFAAVPGDWNTFRSTNDNCTWCDFDSLCPRDRADQADAKADTPELAVRVALVAPGAAEIDGSAPGGGS